MSMNNFDDKRADEKIEEIEKEIPESRNAIDFQALEQIINKWLLIADKGIIKILTATVIANKLQGDPVWLFIITSSGGAKSELIMGLNKIKGIRYISDLTPQTFLSGEKNRKNASLLLRIPDNTIFTHKDFTTVLTMHRDKQHAILSQLREIYDGNIRKEFGTGETKEWEGKLGFIAGVTSIIDRYQTIYQVLGERFIQYRLVQADSFKLSQRAINNSGNEPVMRKEIQNAFADYVHGIEISKEQIKIPEELKNSIAYLSTFCVRARSGVIRDGYSREIDLVPEPEVPTRFAKQLVTMAKALYLISGKYTPEDYQLICKLGMDSLPIKRKLILKVLLKSKDFLETAEIAIKIGYPTNSTRRILEDLHALELIEREHQGQGQSDRWLIKQKTIELLAKSKMQAFKPEEQTKTSVSDKSGELINNVKEVFDLNTLPEMSTE